MPSVDWSSQVPAHEQIAAVLIERLDAGAYEPGTTLPKREVLAEEFGVSPATVSKAVALLRTARRVAYAPGRGLLVLGAADQHRHHEPPTL